MSLETPVVTSLFIPFTKMQALGNDFVFVDGRLDHVVENAGETCAGVTYAPFPELEKMTR